MVILSAKVNQSAVEKQLKNDLLRAQKKASWATNAVTSAVEKVNNVAEESINAISDASEFMQRDLEEFAKVVKEDSTAILSAATEASYQSINHYAGEEIAKETANYTKVNSNQKLLSLSLATCLQKTGSDTGFLARNLDRILENKL